MDQQRQECGYSLPLENGATECSLTTPIPTTVFATETTAPTATVAHNDSDNANVDSEENVNKHRSSSQSAILKTRTFEIPEYSGDLDLDVDKKKAPDPPAKKIPTPIGTAPS